MLDDTRTLFVDTNLFLQVRDLKDVPWADLIPGVRAVDVMVAPRVIEELDRHKTSTNQRKRDRSRLALRLIEEASRTSDRALVVREVPVRVRIVIFSAPSIEWAAYPDLDPSRPDDQIVAAAISFGERAELLSHDTGPRIRARIVGKCAYSPPDDWLLPAEQTDEQRKITKLEVQLAHALSRSPNILVEIPNLDKKSGRIPLFKPRLKPLGDQHVSRLVGTYLKEHPRGDVPVAPTRLHVSLGGISAFAAERYYSDYERFQIKVRRFFAGLHEVVEFLGAAVPIDYVIKNDGGVVAEGLRVEFHLDGNGSLLADRDEVGTLRPPEPPEEPSRGLGFPDVHMTSALALPRDPVAFYWFERPGIGRNRSALQCQEFRATREFRDSMFVLASGDLPAKMDVSMTVSATNLPAPLAVKATLVIAEKSMEWDDPIVLGILPEWISAQIAGADVI